MVETVTIRVLSQADLPLLERVTADVFDGALVPHRAAEFLTDPRHHLIVALAEDSIIGFVSAVHYVHPDKPQAEFWINEAGVIASHQGRGIGKSLMQATLALGRQLGCTTAWVLTELDNIAANRLYATSGGHKTDCVMYEFNLKLHVD